MIDVDFTVGLKPGILHTWLVVIEDPLQELQILEKFLSKDELEHSSRYRFDQDRLRFIIRRGILRLLLGKYIGIDPVKIVYSANSHGKLSLPLSPIQFSISHSQDKVFYGFFLDHVVGVDIERVKYLSDPGKLAEKWFSDAEIKELFHLGAGDTLQGFYHVWTQKEAFVKARGEGLSYPLKDFSVSANPRTQGKLISIKDEDASSWRMLTDCSDPDWRVAVCVQSKRPVILKQNKTTLQDIYLYFPDSIS